ncbi:MAG: HAD hydrolase-like protein [Oscillospiraceae bacterium]|nr:HAD hydrolase-like protein [Oscillospiraceae bacterium]
MRYTVCLFDLDGTLTDPMVGITKSFQYALSYFDIDEALDKLTKVIGPPLRESFIQYYGFSERDTAIAVAKYREHFADKGIFENIVYPDIPSLLEQLTDCNCFLGVATNKPTVYASKILEHFDLMQYFGIVSGDEIDGSNTQNGKRDIILNALSVLDPSRTASAVMIGDRKHDIIGANQVFIDSIGITWGYGSCEELKQAGATTILTDCDELYRYICS